MMKKIFYYILAISLLFNTSCKDFLDLEPQGQENSGNFMNTEENAIRVVNGIYDLLSQTEGGGPDDIWMAHHYDFFFGSIATDDAVKGSNLSDYPELAAIEGYRAQLGNSVTDAFWIHGFWGVSRSNYAIKSLPESPINEELKNRLLGESYFLRAYHYHYLLKHFGGVPLFEEPVSPSDFGQRQRASLHETFEFIHADLERAIALLPEKSQYAASDMGRATKGAARTLLAKSLMYQIGVDNESTKSWQDVYDHTNAIISSGEYTLVNNYATLFEHEFKNSSESIFEVQALDGTAADPPSSVGNAYPLFQSNRVSNPGMFVGWGFHNPTQDLVDAFDPSDPRLTSTVYGIGFNNEVLYGSMVAFDRAQQGSNYLNRKATVPFVPTLETAANKNILLLRYADVLLAHAEAHYHLNNENEARRFLNLVRERARQSTLCKGCVAGDATGFTPPASQPHIPDITVSGEALYNAILLERRIELALEGHRLIDLVRTGQLVERVGKVKDTDRTDADADEEERHQNIAQNIVRHSLVGKEGRYIPVLPIPLTEVQNWGLDQNPGY